MCGSRCSFVVTFGVGVVEVTDWVYDLRSGLVFLYIGLKV